MRAPNQTSLCETVPHIHLGSVVHEESDDLRLEIKSKNPTGYIMTTALLSLKVRMQQAEAIETLLYGCARQTLSQKHLAELRTANNHLSFCETAVPSSADDVSSTPCRPPRPSRRHNHARSDQPCTPALACRGGAWSGKKRGVLAQTIDARDDESAEEK